MKILLSWLKEFIEVSLPAEALAERLTLSGAEVTGLTALEGRDWMFELEVTPNRPDLLSHLGIAREVAAVLGREFRFPRWLKRQLAPLEEPPGDFPIAIDDPQGCRQYVGLLIEGVQIGPSPSSLSRRLEILGVRSVNNVVDVTNLCLLEMGQPLHAFDLDRLEGPSIRVRRAREKEKLTTLDAATLSLKPEHLVIADDHRPVALAGVMGGLETEISPKTKRVLLESAWFDPPVIRRTARGLKLSSESSYRFERGVDPAFVSLAPLRAGRLIAQLAGGKFRGGLIQVGELAGPPSTIALKPSRLQEILGIRVTPLQQKRFLERAGCGVKRTPRGLRVDPPSYRPDLKIPEDLMEEVARLAGYHQIPATLPALAREVLSTQWALPDDPQISGEAQIRRLLSAGGFEELITYRLVNPEDHRKILLSSQDLLQLENPISQEYSVLRKSILIGMLKAVALNLNRKAASSFQLFELGRIFAQGGSGGSPGAVRQPKALGLLAGGASPRQWSQPTGPPGLFHLKGAIESLGERLQIPLQEKIEANHSFSYLSGPAVAYHSGGQFLGAAGQIHPRVLEAFEIPQELPMAFAQLDLEAFLKTSPEPLTVQPLSKVAPVERDLALVVSQEISHENLRQAILLAGAPLLRSAELFDLYKGSQVPQGKRSLAFHLTLSGGDETLTEEAINACLQKVVGSLQAKFQAAPRAS